MQLAEAVARISIRVGQGCMLGVHVGSQVHAAVYCNGLEVKADKMGILFGLHR